jgi:hypothetical protein
MPRRPGAAIVDAMRILHVSFVLRRCLSRRSPYRERCGRTFPKVYWYPTWQRDILDFVNHPRNFPVARIDIVCWFFVGVWPHVPNILCRM